MTRALPVPVGGEGFTMPSLAGAKVSRLHNGNRVIYCASARAEPSVRVKLDRGARDNTVIIGPGSARPVLLHFQGSGNVCVLAGGATWELDLTVRFSSDRGALFVGKGATSNGTSIILEGEGRSVVIGGDCMFAAGTAVRTSDLHAIIDQASGQCINSQADVLLHPHVWVGQDALIGKGVTIGVDAIIAAKAVVVRDVGSNTLVGGIPARLLRDGVSWSRRRPF